MQDVLFESRGLQLRGWLREGNPELPAVLSTHGWLDNANTWLPVAERLSELTWCSIDFPGHGLSDHVRRGESYHFVDNVECVCDVIDALGWQRVALVGHSMGASVAMLSAGVYRDKVSHLVMVDSAGPLTANPDDAASSLREAIRTRRANRQKAHRTYESREALIARMCSANPMLGEAAATTLAERGAVYDGQGWRFRHDLRMRDASALRFTEAHVDSYFAAVDAPALVFRATKGLLQHRPEGLERINALRNVELVDVDADHHAHLTHPDLVVPALRAFLLGSNKGA